MCSWFLVFRFLLAWGAGVSGYLIGSDGLGESAETGAFLSDFKKVKSCTCSPSWTIIPSSARQYEDMVPPMGTIVQVPFLWTWVDLHLLGMGRS